MNPTQTAGILGVVTIVVGAFVAEPSLATTEALVALTAFGTAAIAGLVAKFALRGLNDGSDDE